MPQVIGAAAWKFIVKVVVSYAINALTNKLFGPKIKNSSPTYAFGTLQTQINSSMAMPLIYGKVKCAGNMIWASAPGTVQHKIVSFGVGKIKGFSDIRLSDNVITAITFFTITYTGIEDYGRCRYTGKIFYLIVPSGTVSFDCTSKTGLELITWINNHIGWHATLVNSFNISDLSDINTKHSSFFTWYGSSCKNVIVPVTSVSLVGCNYTAYIGDGEQLIDSRVTGTTQEDKAKIVGGLKYDAYLAITATASEKISNDYNVTAIVEGRIVKIYTSPTTYYEDWSDNPAWCFLDFMTSVDGCGMLVTETDIQTFLNASYYYDELVNGKKRFTFNMIMDEKKSRQDWLDEILITCRSYRTYQRGLHGILVDKPEEVSQVFTVKPDEAIETWWQDNDEDVERLQIEYIDPTYEYTKVVAQADRVQLPGETSQFRNKTPLTKKISIYGINNFEQASREAWFHLNKAQTCPEWIQYTTNKRALNRSIGDIVGVFNPITEVTEPGLTYKRYRIMQMNEPQENKITMGMQEYNPNLYGDTMGSVAPIINITKLDNPTTIPPDVSNIQLAQVYYRQSDGTIVSYITGTCNLPDYSNFSSAKLECSVDDGLTWAIAGETNSDGTFIIDNVKTGSNYFIRIKVINRMGIASSGIISDPIYITGKDNPPPDVESLYVEKTASGNWRFIFMLTNKPVDLAGYKFRYNIGSSTFWDNAIDLHEGLIVSSPFSTNALHGGIFTVMVKAIDNSGNESENAATAIIGLGDEIVNNVIFDHDFKLLGFPGMKENCTVIDALLIANDTGGAMYPAVDNAPMYGPDNAPFYTENWSTMTYEDSFNPEGDGELSFSIDTDGNAQIFYRQRYPYQFYGSDNDLMYPNDDQLMYREAPYIPYSGKAMVSGNSLHDVKLVIGAGTIQGIVREFKTIVDVEDEYEVLNDIVISSTGARLPLIKKYRLIKNVNITIQDSGGATALTFRLADKDISGPLITLYDKNNIAVAGVIDAQIQGIKG